MKYKVIQLDLATLIKDRDYDGIKALIISKAPYLVAAILIIVIGFIIANLIGKLVVKALQIKGVDSSVHSFIKTIVTVMLKMIVIITALSTIKVDVNSFVAALGAAGITAGIGLQKSIAQFASGIQILINHPFKAGDYIDIGSVAGTVKEIKMMYTVLITLDNRRVTVPNSTITDSNIINYNAEEKRRIDLVYSIGYDGDIDKAKDAMRAVIRRNDLILQYPEPTLAVKEHSASSINLACYVWCNSRDYWQVFYYMQEQVKLEFDKQNIVIPFNQVDVHMIDIQEVR